MLNVAMISRWHVHAPGYARMIQEAEDARVSCVWDEDPQRGRAWAEELGVPFVEDYGAVLARSDVDAVLIDSPTNMHRGLDGCARRRPKSTFSRKSACASPWRIATRSSARWRKMA